MKTTFCDFKYSGQLNMFLLGNLLFNIQELNVIDLNIISRNIQQCVITNLERSTCVSSSILVRY